MTNNFYRNYGKRALDILLSGSALVFLSPLLLVLVLLVRVIHGTPVFFTPTRPGKDEKIFKLYKFRTMSNATDKEGKLLPEKERITKLGKFLRATSLDEIPELINIFNGDMSIVGPRPFAMKYLPYYSETERRRHSVRPGLTGLAQISGRNNLPWPQRFEKDLEYIKKMSFATDVSIIFGTASKLLGDTNVTVPGVKKTYQFDTYRVIEEEGSIPQSIKGLSYPEIGGQFWLEEEGVSSKGERDESTRTAWLPEADDSTYTFSGRAALTLALRDISQKRKIKKAYVPSYISFPMLQPFIQENIEYKFYNIEFQQGKVKFEIDKNFDCDIFYFVDYFGTNNSCVKEYIAICKEKGCAIIEDITHTLLNKKAGSKDADYYVASLRKWFPVPTGGWLAKLKGTIERKPSIDSEPAAEKVKVAMNKKNQYINGQLKDKTCFLERMSVFESDLVQLDPMLQIDKVSFNVLNQLDTDKIKEKRKANAQILYNGLSCIEGIKFLNTEAEIKNNVFLFLPILVEHEKRNILQRKLRENGIYCPVHWPETMGADSGIREKELSLVCDQRYSTKDMAIFVEEIRTVMSNL